MITDPIGRMIKQMMNMIVDITIIKPKPKESTFEVA